MNQSIDYEGASLFCHSKGENTMIQTMICNLIAFFLYFLHIRKYLVWDLDGCLVNMYENDDYLEKMEQKRKSKKYKKLEKLMMKI